MRALAHVALALLTLFAVAATLHRLAPYPLDDPLGDKLQLFADHKDDYDLLIIGSSRTMAGVIPKRIEAAMAARGVQIRAFNLAMNAMGTHEADATMRKVLALRPARLRWMLAELDHWDGAMSRKKNFSHRAFLWHDAKTTYSAVRSAFLYARRQNRERMLNHTLHFGGYATALGRGPEVVAKVLNRRKGRRFPRWMTKDQGYLEPGWGGGKDRSTFFSRPCGAKEGVDQIAFYHQRLKKVIAHNDNPVKLSGVDVQAARRRSERLRRAGIVPIHFIPPRLKPTPHLFLLKERSIIEHSFAFNDPQTHPGLYAVENRWDCDHLAQAGAEMLSDLLAERIAELVSSPVS